MIISKFQIWAVVCVLAVALFLSSTAQLGSLRVLSDQQRTDYMVLSERLDQVAAECAGIREEGQ